MSEPIQTPEEGTETTVEVTPEVDQETVAPVPTADEAETPSTEEVPTEPSSPEPQPIPNGYVPKDKFIASAQESILNAERVKVRDARIESLTKQDTPTDEAMK